MTAPQAIAAGLTEAQRRAVPGDYADDAISMARKVQRAVARGTGCRLTADEAMALDIIEGDGDWWNELRKILQEHPQ